MSRLLAGGECNRSPLIIFNTAVAERLKTKSQLRKELWGRSKPPTPLCRDGGWEDFGFRLYLWPQSTKSPSSLFLSGQQIFIYMPSFLPTAYSPFLLLLQAELLTNVPFPYQDCFRWCSKAAQQHLQWLTYNPPPKRNSSSQNISVPIS